MPEIPARQGIADRQIVSGDTNPTTASAKDIRIGRVRRITAPLLIPMAAAPEDTLALSTREVVSWVIDNWQALGTGLGIIGTGVGIASYIYNRRVNAEKLRIARERAQADARIDRERIDNERFQGIINGLSSGLDSKHAVAVQLMSFLKEPGHERFDQQIFKISVNYLRNRDVTKITRLNSPDPRKPYYTERLKSADEAFVQLFLEVAPRVRESLEKGGKKITEDVAEKFLNASGVHLDGAQMKAARLRYIYMENATFKNANLSRADFTKANLVGANLSGTKLLQTSFWGAKLYDAELIQANIFLANLAQADLSFSNLSGAAIYETNLMGTDLAVTNLTGATIDWSFWIKDYRKLPLEKRPAYKADIFGARGLTSEQRKLLFDMGAIDSNKEPLRKK